MGPERKTREKITLPWAMTTEGVSRFMRDWRNAEDARDLMEKMKLDKRQWLKCVDLARKLREKGLKIKVMKLHGGELDELDWNVLKKVAADLER